MAYSGKSLIADFKDCFKVLDKKRNCNGWAILNGGVSENHAPGILGITPTRCAQNVAAAIRAELDSLFIELELKNNGSAVVITQTDRECLIASGLDDPSSNINDQDLFFITYGFRWRNSDETIIYNFHSQITVRKWDVIGKSCTSATIKEKLNELLWEDILFRGEFTSDVKSDNHDGIEDEPDFNSLCDMLKTAKTNEDARDIYERIGDLIDRLA